MSTQQISKCEDCYSCCKAFGELDSELNDIGPKWNRCTKLCSNNRCTIYDSRPDPCGTYKCLYIDLKINKEYLPERIGFVTDLRSGPSGKYLNIIPNESGTYNIDPAEFYIDNIENIMTMKKESESQFSIHIDVINVSCEKGNAQYTFKEKDGK